MEGIYTIYPGVLHENSRYTVHSVSTNVEDGLFILDSTGCPYDYGYALVSKSTGQIELVRNALPDIIYNAEHLCKILEKEPWKWLKDEEAEAMPKFDLGELN